MIAQVVSSLMHVFWSYIFIIKYDMAIVGTGIASTITAGTALLIMVIYTFFVKEIQEAVQCPNMALFNNIPEYLAIGIPCAIMTSSGFMAFHLFTFFAGFFGVAAQNA